MRLWDEAKNLTGVSDWKAFCVKRYSIQKPPAVCVSDLRFMCRMWIEFVVGDDHGEYTDHDCWLSTTLDGRDCVVDGSSLTWNNLPLEIGDAEYHEKLKLHGWYEPKDEDGGSSGLYPALEEDPTDAKINVDMLRVSDQKMCKLISTTDLDEDGIDRAGFRATSGFVPMAVKKPPKTVAIDPRTKIATTYIRARINPRWDATDGTSWSLTLRGFYHRGKVDGPPIWSAMPMCLDVPMDVQGLLRVIGKMDWV